MDDESQRKFFLGGLNYDTDESSLRNYFGKYGTLTDCVVMRFADSKRSRGFGFVTYSTLEEAEACFFDGPHHIDGNNVELKKATPKGEKTASSETSRKIFIGGLSFATTDESLKAYFQQYGTVTDCVVMRFKNTDKSRGFGFVTYSDTSMVDAVQESRPHTIDGARVETKRATSREESAKGDTNRTVKKIFVGGFKDKIEDSDLEKYFSTFGEVTSAKQMTDRHTGRKLGFGFVVFDDYDPVDRIILQGTHKINGHKVDVRKAIAKSEMDAKAPGGQGGRPSGPVWGSSQGGFGGNGNDWENENSGFGGPQGFGRGNWGNGPNNNNSPWGQNNQGGPWGSNESRGPWGSNESRGPWSSGSGTWDTYGNAPGPNSGGPMRYQVSGNNRNAPYPTRGGGQSAFGRW